MAFTTTAGYANLPSGNFTPSIFSQKVLKFFRRASVVEDITNTDYAGEIENYGDTVNIIKEPTITVSSYTRGAVVNPQDLADDQTTLVVDQANAFAFKIDDIEERQSHINWEALSTSSGAYSLKRAYDANVLDLMATSAGLTGESGAATAQIAGIGTLGTALDVGGASTPGDTAVNVMLKMSRALDDQNVPEENRWFIAPPLWYTHLFSAGGKIAEVQVTGDQVSPLRNGMALQGTIAGFKCYKSTALNSSGGTDQVTISGLATDGTEHTIMAGHISSTATASHIAKTEVVRSTESFSDVVRGLHVFGRKVLRAEAIVRGQVSLD
tara:strand:- start:284 stop:1258 length:975 start_codon:yes stop_codon:yes gene_type:complete